MIAVDAEGAIRGFSHRWRQATPVADMRARVEAVRAIQHKRGFYPGTRSRAYELGHSLQFSRRVSAIHISGPKGGRMKRNPVRSFPRNVRRAFEARGAGATQLRKLSSLGRRARPRWEAPGL